MSVRSILLAASSPIPSPGNKWVTRDSLQATGESFAPDSVSVRGIIHGGSKYVVFGDSNTVAYSTDLSTWGYSNAIPNVFNILSMAYGNGVYVAVGTPTSNTRGSIFTSTDAITWTMRTTPTDWDPGDYPIKVLWSGTLFLIVGSTNAARCATSLNGVSWQNQAGLALAFSGLLGGAIALLDVVYTGTRFYAVTRTYSHAAWSTNGVTWTYDPSLYYYVGTSTSRIACYGSKIVGYALNGGFVYASANSGLTWTTVNDLPSVYVGLGNPSGIATDGTTLVSSDLLNGYSYDAALFDVLTPPTAYVIPSTTFDAYPYTPDQRYLSGAVYIDGGSYPGYYLFGWRGRLWYLGSTAGTIASPTNVTTALTKQDLYFTSGWDAYAIAYDGTNIVVAGENGRIAKGTSADVGTDTNFSIKSNTLNQVANWGSASNINAVIWALSKYIAIGAAGRVATSTDGTTWTYQAGLRSTSWGASNNVLSIASNGSTVLVGGQNGAIASSSDGVTWVYQSGLSSTTWGTAAVNGLAWDGSKYLAVGDSGKVASSTDGVTWTYISNLTVTSWGTTKCNAICWSSGLSLFVVVGENGLIATSSNGTAWTVATSNTTSHLRAITFANSKFVAVGGNTSGSPVVLSSTTGASWINRSPYLLNTDWASNQAYGVIWAGDRFIICGTNGRLASSP